MTLGRIRASAILALLLGTVALVGWFDYRATSGELRALVGAEADTLYATIAAAARVQHAAATAAEGALGQRLLEQARLLAVMDQGKRLDRAALGSLAASPDVFRVVVFDAAGRREMIAGEAPAGPGGGFGRGIGPAIGRGPRPRDARGMGLGGPPAGASRIAQRLISGEAAELVAASHAARDGEERIAAGVRRSGGGAIVVNAANQLARELESVYSLDALVTRIVAATPALAYIILGDDQGRVARGPFAEEASRMTSIEGRGPMDSIGAVPVLERRGSITLDEARTTELRIGMRLDEVQRAERRALVRISGALGSLSALAILAVAFGALRHRYGDLSKRHAHAEEALRRRDRLASMGEMASTVAHEIRNPLNAIAMSAQRLAREYPQLAGIGGTTDEAAELVDVIQRESSRIDRTVQRFLEFARPRPMNPRDVSVSQLLKEVLDASSPLAGTREVQIALDNDASGNVFADADQLRQALDNLVRNAVEATPPGGRVTLSSGRRGKWVHIQVRDTGAGIPVDVLPRIFDLYFTTKRDGTGVGLAIVQQIVNAHGGTIAVDSQPGTGTSVRIELPRDRVRHG